VYDRYIYIQDICNDENFWKQYTIQSHHLPSWTVNMWDSVFDDYQITWKDLARLYELETISGYKLNFKDIVDWHEKLMFNHITREELHQLFKYGKPIPVEIQGDVKYITISPDMLLKDIIKKIRDTRNIKINDVIFELFFYQPIKGGDHDEDDYIRYNENKDIVEFFNIRNDQWYWYAYADLPIGENKIFDLLNYIKVNKDLFF
jgi:hypothetical protein